MCADTVDFDLSAVSAEIQAMSATPPPPASPPEPPPVVFLIDETLDVRSIPRSRCRRPPCRFSSPGLSHPPRGCGSSQSDFSLFHPPRRLCTHAALPKPNPAGRRAPRGEGRRVRRPVRGRRGPVRPGRPHHLRPQRGRPRPEGGAAPVRIDSPDLSALPKWFPKPPRLVPRADAPGLAPETPAYPPRASSRRPRTSSPAASPRPRRRSAPSSSAPGATSSRSATAPTRSRPPSPP